VLVSAFTLSTSLALAQPLRTFAPPDDSRVSTARLSADASTLVANLVNAAGGFSSRAIVWNASGSIRSQFTSPDNFLFPIALSADGSTLLASVTLARQPTLFHTTTLAATPIPNSAGSLASDLSADASRAALTITTPTSQLGVIADTALGPSAPTSTTIPGSRDAGALSADGLTVVGQLSDFAGYRSSPQTGTQPLCTLAFGAACPGLSTGEGITSLVPVGISADASTVVGGAAYANGAGAAFALSSEGYQELVSCAGLGYGSALALDASADGSTIVGDDSCANFGPWVWREATGVQTVRAIADAYDIDANIFFLRVDSVSDDGSTISGTLLLPNASDAVAYTLQLPPQSNCDSIDFNADSLFPDDQDLIDFLSVLAGGSCSPGNTCNDIDFNNDSLFPDDQDLIAFLRVLAGGDCT
jgi:hypothetical protein